jgi:uncharacterized HAD superfamily protein/hypoxanthine phosphoribosyltransferase
LQFRSYADLATLLATTADRIHESFDIVVGIPRSGLVPASMIALLHNKPLADLDGFLSGQILGRGRTRAHVEWSSQPADYRRVLVVDDSINRGATMEAARERLAELDHGIEPTFLAVYAYERSTHLADTILEVCPKPRIFEWNMLHAWLPERACFDLDGVLCRDPTPEENDDGERYREYVSNVAPLALPSRPIRRIVTSRLERFRPETEAWLKKHGVEYGHLDMLDLPTAEERRRRGAHASFKARIYAADPDSMLFVESESAQAASIARRSGKPVLDYSRKCMADPFQFTFAYQVQAARRFSTRVRTGLMRRIRRQFG